MLDFCTIILVWMLVETIKANEQKKCFHQLLVHVWKAQILFHFSSTISTSVYSSVQNTCTDNVGKRTCEVTGKGEEQDRHYWTVFPPAAGAQPVLTQHLQWNTFHQQECAPEYRQRSPPGSPALWWGLSDLLSIAQDG